jgi:dCTP deaminase
MAVLTGWEIADQIRNGRIMVSPYSPAKISPVSLNVTLGNTIVTYNNRVLDCKLQEPTSRIEIPSREGLLLQPGTVYLGHTVERIHTDHYAPVLEGRSSVGRLGLEIHISAGWGDPGFDGTWTLELSVVQPLWIYAGMEIGQIVFHTLTGEPKLYIGKYQDQALPMPSGLWKESHKWA